MIYLTNCREEAGDGLAGFFRYNCLAGLRIYCADRKINEGIEQLLSGFTGGAV